MLPTGIEIQPDKQPHDIANSNNGEVVNNSLEKLVRCPPCPFKFSYSDHIFVASSQRLTCEKQSCFIGEDTFAL